MGGKFKLHLQDSDLEYLFWQCEKCIALSEKKATFSNFFHEQCFGLTVHNCDFMILTNNWLIVAWTLHMTRHIFIFLKNTISAHFKF